MAEYYTIQDVAEKTGKSQKTIRRHIAAKKLVATRIQINGEFFQRTIIDGLSLVIAMKVMIEKLLQ